MNSNVTMRSNVYVNRTGTSSDPEFLRHVTDYRVLKRYKSHGGLSNTDWWMTSTQKEILNQGQPKCSMEKGTMSWGVPIGSDLMVCRCEQEDCPRFSICSQYSNFQMIERVLPEKKETGVSASELPLYPEWKKIGLDTVPTATADAELLDSSQAPINDQPDEVSANEKAAREEELKVDAAADKDVPSTVITESSEQIKTKSNEVPTTVVGAVSEPVMASAQEKTHKENELVDRYEGPQQTVSQETIIHANCNERIWVNAGPGTGKTYTVIKRILYLVDQDMDGSIVVLCFSRNAVQEIRARLTTEIGIRAAQLIDDGTLIIRTFDSFASYMLDDELDSKWNYDQRIEAFIRSAESHRDDLRDMIGYLIVDELQDTVGVRARMLLKLLEIVNCGVLLLGDQCQAIFDWTIREKKDMAFDTLSGKLISFGLRRYELQGNHRQVQKLEEKGQELRKVLLEENEEAQEAEVNLFKDWIKDTWKSCTLKGLAQSLSGEGDLILCKTNGEAAHVSQVLYDSASSIDHIMKKSTNHRPLAAWIAKVLFGNDGRFIDYDTFTNNAEEYGVEDVDTKWHLLKSLDGHPHAAVLHIPEVLSALSKGDSIPDECLAQHEHAAIVSTVHRAKGSEAEHVYWMDSPLVFDGNEGQDDAVSDAVKAAYVAITRAKKDIRIVEQGNFLMKAVSDERWIRWNLSKNKKRFCNGIAMLPDDVDYASFAQDDNAEEKQLLISALEPGLEVDLWPDASKKRFDIYFDGLQVGFTSSSFTQDLYAGFRATNNNKNWPAEMGRPFITDVITVIAPERIDVNEKFRKMGCWLGVELGGFPYIRYGDYS